MIRRASADDAPGMAAAHATGFEPSWSAPDIARFTDAPGGFAFVDVDPSGQIVGFILCRALAGEAEILTIAVHTDHRRRGLGAALVDRALTAALASANAMILEVAVDNDAAISVYKRAGFETVGRRPGYYVSHGGPPKDAIVMRRALNT
ncbi:MAG TPA: N-acetyltransferase [Caulobacteraceae bacterium]|jgi:ribosomal-protein-alanine N-acetyltransferase